MQTDDIPPPDQSPRQHVLTLPVLLVIGWLIYEFTASPGLAAVAMCLKFGWEDFRIARWLQLSDPDRHRGRACYWLYLSSGLWKVAITSLAMIFLIIVLASFAQGPAGWQLLPMLAGAGVTLIFGFGFSALACFIALGIAWRHRIRLWLNGAVYRARLHRAWPPLYGQDNRILALLITTVIVTCMLLIPGGLAIACAFLEDNLPDKTRQGILAIGSVVSVMLLLPLMALKLRDLKTAGFFADHPTDCWGEERSEGAGDIAPAAGYNEELTR